MNNVYFFYFVIINVRYSHQKIFQLKIKNYYENIKKFNYKKNVI